MTNSVAIVEDNPGFRATLARLLNQTPGFACTAQYASAEEALASLPGQLPAVVLMDIHLPRLSGIECTARLKRLCPKLQILMLTVYEDTETIFKALKAGASGYLLKRADPEDILRAIREVREGGAPMTGQIARKVIQFFQTAPAVSADATAETGALSEREREVLEQLSRGYLTKEIASNLGVTPNTVRTHLQHIYAKLHVRCRTEAVARYLR